jgi:hypothetical protein
VKWSFRDPKTIHTVLYTLITHCYHISDIFKRQCVAYIIYRILTIIQQISEGSCRIMLRIEVIQIVLKQTIQHYLFMSNLQQCMKPEFYTLGMPLSTHDPFRSGCHTLLL